MGPWAGSSWAFTRRVHRLTGSKASGRPLLYLHDGGCEERAATRTAVVMPFPEGDDVWLIVASRNGAAGHPAWLYNLAAHPDQVEVEVDGRKTAVTPQTLTGEDRASAWERIMRERPNFAEYEQKTDRASRSCVSAPAERSGTLGNRLVRSRG